MGFPAAQQNPCLLALSVLLLIVPVLSQRWGCSETVTWDSVSPEDYDMNYSPITNAEARPLGFKVGSYNYDTNHGTCVIVSGTKRKRLAVRVETQPQATICIKGNGVEKCADADGTISLCQEFVGEDEEATDTTRFEFFCNGECHEADVLFWYRFTVSSADNSDDDEQWCWNQPVEFPTHLVNIPFVRTTKVVYFPSKGVTSTPMNCLPLSLLLFVVHLLGKLA